MCAKGADYQWGKDPLEQLMVRFDSYRAARNLGVTAYDLYVPVRTFVLGEAQLCGNCAVVSAARLSDEYYGLPPNPTLLRERWLKEAAHELGHTFGLRHCSDWRCVMSNLRYSQLPGRVTFVIANAWQVIVFIPLYNGGEQ